MNLRFSIDDGFSQDIRLLELLEKYGFADKAVFYIATANPNIWLLTDDSIREIAKRAEVGSHTLHHEVLTRLAPDEQWAQIMGGITALEAIIGKKPEKFAPPRGWYNDQVIESARKCGVSEFRTMKQGCIIDQAGSFVQPISVHFHPEHYKEYLTLFPLANTHGGYFHVTCHSWELQKFDLWEEYEEMLKFIKDRYEN